MKTTALARVKKAGWEMKRERETSHFISSEQWVPSHSPCAAETLGFNDDAFIHHVHQPADVGSSVTVGQIRATEG